MDTCDEMTQAFYSTITGLVDAAPPVAWVADVQSLHLPSVVLPSQ